jgi:hypothetical protein
MNGLRDQLAEIVDSLKVTAVDQKVDSALRLLKAFLRIRDAATRVAFVELAESLARKSSSAGGH